MKNFHLNHYERAFASWLRDNHIHFLTMDEAKRAAISRSKIKTFDYLIYPPDQPIMIAEIKGRKFTGTSLAKLSNLQNWVTFDDVEGLANWQKLLGSGHKAFFIFAYHLEMPDIDLDGRTCYDFNHQRYIFFAIALDDYCSLMTVRSPRWKTVSISAADFRQKAVQLQPILS